MTHVLKRWVLGLTAAYISLLPNFYHIFNAVDRVNLFWNREYHAAILTAVAVVGLIYLAIYAVMLFVVRRHPAVRYPVEVLAYTALFALGLRTILSILYRSGLLEAAPWCYLANKVGKLLYYFLIPGTLIALHLPLAERIIRRLYALVAPAVLFLMVWPVTYQNFSPENPPLPPIFDQQKNGDPSPAQRDIYIFFFDEWSYERCFPEGQPWGEMTNLCAVLSSMTCYSEAYTPGSRTITSIPRFLFQNNKSVCNMDYNQLCRLVLRQTPLVENNIFSEAKRFFRVVVGFTVDYTELLGSSVEFSTSIHNESAWRTYGREAEFLILTQFAWLRVFGIHPFTEKDPPSVVWIYSLRRAHQIALKTIRDLNQPVMAFFHYCLPHYPYVWNRNGMKDPWPDDVNAQTVPNYMDNLRRLDTIIGEIVSALKQSGKWDSSLVIMTSDHAWRYDPDLSGFDPVREDSVPHSRWKHVPLIIKRPHQRKAEVVSDPISTADIYPIIQQVIRSIPATDTAKRGR
jgi:hypothetical protein